MAKDAKEINLEADIEAFLTSAAGGYFKCNDKTSYLCVDDGSYTTIKGGYVGYDRLTDGEWVDMRGRGIDILTLVNFIQTTQPKTWELFEKRCGGVDPYAKFYKVFQDAVVDNGIISVLKSGFKHRGLTFRVVYFKPENTINQKEVLHYKQNVARCIRQWHYSSSETNKTVDMLLDVNGIPLIALELKDQFTGQTVENAKYQWKTDRDARETVFKFNSRILAFFAVDLTEVYMATALKGESTYFLPFNQGSNGAGNDGEAGNPPNPDGYQTSYLWEEVLQKDSLLDILKRYVHLQEKEEEEPGEDGQVHKRLKKTIIFPRYHQLDVVRKIVADVLRNGTGKNYLIQHSAGSGKSNSIAWSAYQLSTLYNENNQPVFDSVVIVTDRTVLDRQLQGTIKGIEHVQGQIAVIDDKCTSQDLKEAINSGVRLIVSTLQKYSVVYNEIESAGKHFCVIVDEAHSSQTGKHAEHLNLSLADSEEVLKEFEDYEEQWEDEDDQTRDGMLQDMVGHGRHANLTFLAFTATPKDKTLELFGTEMPDGTYVPYHVYSMRQAIQEGFILDPLAHYVTYKEALEIARKTPENPNVYSSPTLKLLRKYKQIHPYAIGEKSKVIVEAYRDITAAKIGGRGKMMVVTSSRLAAVRYTKAIRTYIKEQGYGNIEVLAAFSGKLRDPAEGADGPEYSESSMNIGHNGQRVKESQTKSEFHNWGSILVVAEKYQTGFDEPYLHTLIVDKKLKREKAVQTICRIDRTESGKDDTLVIDFVNEREDILKAFQPFFTETDLAEAIDTDRIYGLIGEIQNYGVYTEDEVEAAAKLEFGRDRTNMQGKLSGIMKPAVERYDKLTQEQRYQYRRKVRSFVKWYGYVTQLVRMFDRELHKEAVFLSYLEKLLKSDKIDVRAIDDLVRLDYYKLEHTWEGAIKLEDKRGTYEQGKPKGDKTIDKRIDPLQVLIDKVNEEYAGDLSEDDKVIIKSIFRRSGENARVKDSIVQDGRVVFTDSTWPSIFASITMEAYKQNAEAFRTIFEDKSKYNAIMKAVGKMLIDEYGDGE